MPTWVYIVYVVGFLLTAILAQAAWAKAEPDSKKTKHAILSATMVFVWPVTWIAMIIYAAFYRNKKA